jgi:hypothetical protein
MDPTKIKMSDRRILLRVDVAKSLNAYVESQKANDKETGRYESPTYVEPTIASVSNNVINDFLRGGKDPVPTIANPSIPKSVVPTQPSPEQ